jgi:hypothetical protein
LILVSASLWLTGSPALAGQGPAPPAKVTPGATGVLFLPALDATADSAHMQAPRQWVIRHREEYEFITRRFKVLGEGMAIRAAKTSPVLDLGNLSVRNGPNMDELARRAGADWVVSVVVREVKTDTSSEGGFVIHTMVLLRVWDAGGHQWLVDQAYQGRAQGGDSPVFVFKDSLDNAVKGALGKLLGAYPQVVPVLKENSLVDYLKGQTQPFTGETEKPFSGLSPNH